MRKIFHYKCPIIDALCIPINFILENDSSSIHFTINLLSNYNLFFPPMLSNQLAFKPLKIASAIAKIIFIPTSYQIKLGIIIGS